MGIFKRVKIELRDIVIVILLIIILVTKGNNRNVTIDNPYTYLPDTIYTDKGYQDRIDKLEKITKDLLTTPPKVVHIYNPKESNSTILEKIPDSIIVLLDSLNKRISIADTYIKNYPTNHKLLDFKLGRENLDISTMGINGFIYESEYPLYLDQYDYYWINNELKHVPRKKPYTISDPNKWKYLYGNIGYDLIQEKPLLSLDYNLQFYRFRLRPELKTTIEKKPYIEGNIYLGYRLLD